MPSDPLGDQASDPLKLFVVERVPLKERKDESFGRTLESDVDHAPHQRP